MSIAYPPDFSFSRFDEKPFNSQSVLMHIEYYLIYSIKQTSTIKTETDENVFKVGLMILFI